MTWLSSDDLRQFARDGYIVMRGVVAEWLLAAADDEIDGLIAEVPPDEGTGGPGTNAWFSPRARLPRSEAVLRRSPVLSIADQLVAPHHLDFAFDHVQVSTTMPPHDHVPEGPHIDGHGPGMDPPASFTLLADVILTDQTAASSGNIWVWPGSHLDHQRLFQERGTNVLQATGGHSTMLVPRPVLQPPVPVLAGPGDVLLAHYLLGHNKGGNTGRHQRRTLYYRLAAPDHAAHWDRTFVDAWTEFAPVRAALPRL